MPRNGHRPQLLEHLAEVFPRHIQIHYGRYQPEELFEAARRSRACAYLADDDHGPLALQEILLAGCPTVGVWTGAAFVRTGETGGAGEPVPPGRHAWKAKTTRRRAGGLHGRTGSGSSDQASACAGSAAEDFQTTSIVDQLVNTLDGIKGPAPRPIWSPWGWAVDRKRLTWLIVIGTSETGSASLANSAPSTAAPAARSIRCSAASRTSATRWVRTIGRPEWYRANHRTEWVASTTGGTDHGK